MTTYIQAVETGKMDSDKGEYNPRGETKRLLAQAEDANVAKDMVNRFSRIYKHVATASQWPPQ